MKIITSVIILVILLLTFSILGYYRLVDYSQKILNELEGLEESIINNNWNQAEVIREKIINTWQKAESFFPFILDHAEFHDLNITLTKIYKLIDIQDKKMILLEIAVAKKLIEHIPEQEKFNLKNIF